MAGLKSWGYLGTLGWAIAAFVVGQFAGFGFLLWLHAGALNSILVNPYDGILVTLFILISNPITIAVIVLAVRFLDVKETDYLALKWPARRDVITSVAWLVVLIALSDALLYVSGRSLVTPFQLQSYTTAAAENWLWPMFAAAVFVAPAGEEVMFRGFLFRGWARTEQSTWPAIIVISVLWAALHIQYDWTGMLEIMVVGLFLGWVRWRSGSIILTFILHALFNLEATFETLLAVHFLRH
jgi:membrane protease YdiL (CAAX protease family)